MSEIIHVKLPDGSVRDVPRGTSALDIAKSISPRLADAALAAQIKPLSSNGNGSGGNGHHPLANEPPAPRPLPPMRRPRKMARSSSTLRVRWSRMPSCASSPIAIPRRWKSIATRPRT